MGTGTDALMGKTSRPHVKITHSCTHSAREISQRVIKSFKKKTLRISAMREQPPMEFRISKNYFNHASWQNDHQIITTSNNPEKFLHMIILDFEIHSRESNAIM